MNKVSRNIAHIQKRITEFCKIHHQKQSPKIIAVSKNANIEQIDQAIAAGQKIFAENYVQDAKDKWLNLLQKNNELELHLIGHLQSNKVKDAVALFDVIQSLDSLKLAKILHKEMQKQKKFPKVFLQVNIGEESQKYGLLPDELVKIVKKINEEFCFKISGLMAIAPQGENSSPYFALLKKLAQDSNISCLSMGMSDDFDEALAMGTNYLRLGRAVFE